MFTVDIISNILVYENIAKKKILQDRMHDLLDVIHIFRFLNRTAESYHLLKEFS